MSYNRKIGLTAGGEMRRKLALTAYVAAFVLLVQAEVPRSPMHAAMQDAAANPLAAANVQRGEKLYASNCAFCHGATAKGSATGVSLIDSGLVRHDKNADLIGAVLRDGRPDKGMPAFTSLDAGQVSDLAAFLHARITVMDSVESSGPRGGYQLQHLLTGSPEAGKAYFDGVGGCAKCHSASGDLAGVAKKYQPTELESKMLYPRAEVATVTVTLPSGETVQGRLRHLDPFSVALNDATGRYRSFALPGPRVAVQDPMQAHVALLGRYTDKDVHDVFAYLESLR